MGGLFSKKGKATTIICVGLDNSGKSTTINYLKPTKEKTQDLMPTVGFMVERFRRGNANFTVFDMGGSAKSRRFWEHYFKQAQGIIFVIDSADKFRMSVVKDELAQMLSHPEIVKKDIPVLFFANKKDLADAMTAAEVSKIIELDRITDRAWRIIRSNAVSGEGLEEGIKWLSDHIK
eukprot:TRINITY_DN106980_c0_g1_i1.p2 TRINITY_DN106980_c0_g1~~TRINITY_DN106980_c0_g1_i1.p2  ORF type:complete len:177 (+),score=92.64 TRINITY_DN106980_c0_g1_i1:113-643(+)